MTAASQILTIYSPLTNSITIQNKEHLLQLAAFEAIYYNNLTPISPDMVPLLVIRHWCDEHYCHTVCYGFYNSPSSRPIHQDKRYHFRPTGQGVWWCMLSISRWCRGYTETYLAQLLLLATMHYSVALSEGYWYDFRTSWWWLKFHLRKSHINVLG